MFSQCSEPMLFEGYYLLGTVCKTIDCKKADRDSKNENTQYIYGSTGKGNDQVRFEMGYYANNPE